MSEQLESLLSCRMRFVWVAVEAGGTRYFVDVALPFVQCSSTVGRSFDVGGDYVVAPVPALGCVAPSMRGPMQ